MVDLDRTLGLLERAVVGRFNVAAADHRAHQFVHAAVDHPLPVVHDGPDELVGFRHEPVLEEHGHVVPVHDPRTDLVTLERAHELPVPDAVGYSEHEAAATSEFTPHAGPEQELDSGQVDLAQVPGVVHVRQVHVQVGGQAHGRVRGRFGDPERPFEPRGRDVAEQRPEKVRQVQRAHGKHDERQRRARSRQRHNDRRRAVAVGDRRCCGGHRGRRCHRGGRKVGRGENTSVRWCRRADVRHALLKRQRGRTRVVVLLELRTNGGEYSDDPFSPSTDGECTAATAAG